VEILLIPLDITEAAVVVAAAQEVLVQVVVLVAVE
jgi:hypothetical protein